MTLEWTLKRVGIGIAILFAFVTGAALLFDAAIESEPGAEQTVAAPNPVIR